VDVCFIVLFDRPFMEPPWLSFLRSSTGIVALAEIGDKTQLLALLLVLTFSAFSAAGLSDRAVGGYWLRCLLARGNSPAAEPRWPRHGQLVSNRSPSR